MARQVRRTLSAQRISAFTGTLVSSLSKRETPLGMQRTVATADVWMTVT
jgi:hypothetical protein